MLMFHQGPTFFLQEPWGKDVFQSTIFWDLNIRLKKVSHRYAPTSGIEAGSYLKVHVPFSLQAAANEL